MTAQVERVLAPNPGPMTLDGTNTWVLRAGEGARSVVVDPGPADDGHLDAVRAAAGRGPDEVAVVLLTHRHPDHSEAAATFAASVGCGVRAADPDFRVGAGGLADGDVIDVDGLELLVLGTPGHTSDSVCLLLTGEGSLLTGDTVLGRGPTVVAHPDGRLGPYLDSVHRLRTLVARGEVTRLLPGHGPVSDDPAGLLDALLAHRRDRLEQVRRAVADGATTPAEVVATVYADVDPALRPAAEQSVAAQLDHLAADG